MTKRKINWSELYARFVLGLMLAGTIYFIIWGLQRDKENEAYLRDNYVYTIGYFDCTERIKTSKEYYFIHTYMDSIYSNNITSIDGQDFYKIRAVLNDSNPGDRFLVKLSPESPRNASVILVDYPVPLDIAKAPSEGWKEIPDWDQERAKGNILDLPYDGSKYVKYVYPPKDPIVDVYVYSILAFILISFMHKKIWAFLKEIKQKW